METMASDLPRILLIEDDRTLARGIAAKIGRAATVETVDTAEEALARLHENTYDVAIVDIYLAGFTSGVYVVGDIGRLPAERRPAVIVSSGAEPAKINCIDRSTIAAIFRKPLDLEAFCAEVCRVAREHNNDTHIPR